MPETLFLRVTPELKRAVQTIAAELGLTDNAAAIVLLNEAIEARRRDRG